MKIELIKHGDPRLKQVCEKVVDFENKEFYQDLINQIKEESIKDKAFAVAAPQFGVNKRFIIMISPEEVKPKDIQDFEESYTVYEVTPYFNPKITVMRGLQYYYEACMSTGDAIGRVARPYYIEFDYQDIDGNLHHRSAEEFEAIIFCHEIDHLNGIEFVDKAENLLYGTTLEQRIEIRNNYPRTVISTDGEFPQNKIEEKYRTKSLSKK